MTWSASFYGPPLSKEDEETLVAKFKEIAADEEKVHGFHFYGVHSSMQTDRTPTNETEETDAGS